MKNYEQPGVTLTVTAPEAVAAGRGLLVGALFGIAATDAADGAEVEITTLGVYSHPKTSAQAWTQGAKIYWDNTAKVFTTTVSANTLVGVATAAAVNPSATGKVRLGLVA